MGITRKQMTNVGVVEVVHAPMGQLLKFRAYPGSGRCLEHCLPILRWREGASVEGGRKKRVNRICETISELTGRDQTLLDQEMVVAKLNRTMIGWANYFCLGPVSKAYQAVDQHARNRLLQWLCAKHKLVWPAAKRFPEPSLHEVLGLVCLTKRTSNFPWATS